jgi:phospholipid/cholesterol/gamma-HCH transport system permease protein
MLDSIGSFVLLTSRTLWWLVRPPYRFGQLLLAMEFIGVQSIFIVSLTGIFSGMVLALQTTNA